MATQCGCSCASASPIEELKSEHRVIERVLNATERMLATGRFEKQFYTQMIDFVRNFADGCHHAKEEDQLFPALERAGVPRENGPIGCMLHEHEQGRVFIRTIEANLDGVARDDAGSIDRLRSAAEGYIALLRLHIQKEDQVLFALANSVLDHAVQAQLRHAFDCTENSAANRGKHERYLMLAGELCRQADSGAVPSCSVAAR